MTQLALSLILLTYSLATSALTPTKSVRIIIVIQKSVLRPQGEVIENICNFQGNINLYDARETYPRITKDDIRTFNCIYNGGGQNLSITFGAFASLINSKYIESAMPDDIFGNQILKAVFPVLFVETVDDQRDYQPGISTIIGSLDLKATSLFGAITPEISEVCDLNGENCESSHPFKIKASFKVYDFYE